MLTDKEFNEKLSSYTEGELKAVRGSCESQELMHRALLIDDELKQRISKHELAVNNGIPENTDISYAKKYLNKVKNARERNISFDLSFNEYKSIIIKKSCFYTGIRLNKNDSSCPTYITVDRIDANRGYTKDNCVACSSIANSIKNAVLEDPRGDMLLTIKQFKKMAGKL